MDPRTGRHVLRHAGTRNDECTPLAEVGQGRKLLPQHGEGERSGLCAEVEDEIGLVGRDAQFREKRFDGDGRGVDRPLRNLQSQSDTAVIAGDHGGGSGAVGVAPGGRYHREQRESQGAGLAGKPD